MCAIAGIIGDKDNRQTVDDMCSRMVLRGPDYHESINIDNVTLGHCRLSIIDLSTGNQPMTSIDGNVTIVFNGEIYNFLEIKKELADYQFQTTSDTEVLIAGYQKYGIEGILAKLEGMYAFCLYDRTKRTCYLVRDKYGEKPLYYEQSKGQFKFASELKAFDPNLKKYDLDLTALNFYIALSYIPAPYSIYRQIRKVVPGHYLVIKEGGIVEDCCYYSLADKIKEPISDTYEQAKEKIKSLMYDSIEKRMIADVPTGAFLSGGIDSSVVCSVMHDIDGKPFNTFSIGFKQKEYDESQRAQLVADRIKSLHNLHYLEYSDVVDSVDDIISYYDEPFSDSSAIPSYYVAKLAHEKVKVVLTGDAADEIFAGYEKYMGHYYVDKYRKLPVIVKCMIKLFSKKCPSTSYTNRILRKIRKVVRNADSSEFDVYYNLMCLAFPDDQRIKLLKVHNYIDIKAEIQDTYNQCPSDSELNKEQFCDFHYVLEGDMFPKVDRACMHNSLESRTPILDSRIVEYAFRMNPEFKLCGKNKKRILKDTFKEILPPQTIKFPKSGFGVPVGYWLRNELKEELTRLIDKDFILKQGLFNYDYIIKLFNDHISGEKYNDFQLWNIYVFQKWYLRNTTNIQ